jgi:hypothetical protein
VVKLAEAGLEVLKMELAETIARKKTELASLRRVVAEVQDLAGDADTTYPTEIQIAFTARSSLGRLITKNESIVLADRPGALVVVEDLQRRENDRSRLRDEMIEELKQDQRQLSEVKKELPSFVASTEQLVTDVLALAS